MIKPTRPIVVATSTLALSLALVACGNAPDNVASDPQSSEQSSVQETRTYSHDALVDPKDIEPGTLAEEDAEGNSAGDLWWPNGNINKGDALYFSNANNNAGMSVTFVHEDNGMTDTAKDLVVEDGHLITEKGARGEERSVDITFQDDFTCYDAVSDATYIRGDRSAEDYQKLMAGKTFVEDASAPKDFELVFAKDGTLTQTQYGESMAGTWRVAAPNVVVCHFADYDEWGNELDSKYHLTFDKDGDVAELDDGSFIKLVAFDK